MRRHGLRFYNNVSHRKKRDTENEDQDDDDRDKGAGSGMAAPGIPRIRIIILMPGYVSVRPFLSAFNLERK